MQRVYNVSCFAVEPNFDLFQKLSLDDSRKFHGAISKVKGPVNFYINDNLEASSLTKDQAARWGESKLVQVEGISWKKLIERFGLQKQIIDVLKIDIEGAELELIDSMDEDDLNKITQITIEFHDWLNKDLHSLTVKMIKKLVLNGFSCFTTTPNHDFAVEATFIRKSALKLNNKQKLALKSFDYLKFLKY